MKQTIRSMSKLLTAAIGFQSLLLAINPQAALAATPNNISNIANHVVISQVYPDGVMGQEFIELYNPTKQDISLAGYDLAKFNNPADLTDITDFDIAQTQTTIKAGGYYLIASDIATPAVTADATYSSAAHSLGMFDAVALINENAGNAIIDRVGWALADKELCEGYDTAMPATNTCADDAAVISPLFVRQPDSNEGNGIDTDNNKNDFFTVDVSVATPRNSATTPVFAAAPTIGQVSPADSSYTNSSSVTIMANVADDHFANATLTIDGTAVTPGYTYTASIVSFNPITLADSKHTVTLTATDAAGFSTSKTWNFTVDTVKPTLKLDNLKTEVTSSGAFTTVWVRYDDTLSGVTKMILSTDGTFDTEVWQPLAETVRVQLPSKEGTQTVYARVQDRSGNISDIATTTAKVTAVAIAAPDFSLTSTTGNTVTITWSPVAGATSYLVRYNDGTTLYGPISTTSTSLKINNLDLKKNYHFEVAAVNVYGAISSYTAAYTPENSPAKDKFMTASSTGNVAVTNAVAETTTVTDNENNGQITQRTAPSSYTVNPTPQATISPAPSPSSSPEGEIKSDTDDRNPDWTKIIVALSILIIAAGVATGGWYLYQWWTSQPKDNGKGKKGGRW